MKRGGFIALLAGLPIVGAVVARAVDNRQPTTTGTNLVFNGEPILVDAHPLSPEDLERLHNEIQAAPPIHSTRTFFDTQSRVLRRQFDINSKALHDVYADDSKRSEA